MATINLGSLKFNWTGAYNSSTSYAVDDVASANGNSYVCIQAHSNQAVGDATAYWNIMSAKGTNGTDGTDGTDVGATLTTQGDILIRNGSGIARLGYGTSGQFLKTLGSGQNPAWASVSAGIKQIKFSPSGTTQYTIGSSSYTDVGSNYQVTITPTSSSNRILLYTQFADQGSSAGRTYYNFKKEGDSSGNGDLIANGGWANVENINTAGNGFTSGMMVTNDIASTNALTYKLRMKTNGNNSHVNVADSISFMMAMELDGGLF
jgi:hypothetical protein